jgi:hypothetical protein
MAAGDGPDGVRVPKWLLFVLLLLVACVITGGITALALGGGSSDNAVSTTATSTSTSTTSASGASSGGSPSGGTPAGKSSTKTPAPTVTPHLTTTDFGTCFGRVGRTQAFFVDPSWTTTNATELTIHIGGSSEKIDNPKNVAAGFSHFNIKCEPDHILAFTATGPGGTHTETVTLSYVIDQRPHVINFSAPATTDCQGGTNASVPFAYGTVNATSVKLSVSASSLPRTSGTTSFGFTCPQMYLGTNTYQVTLTATNSFGSDTRTIPVSLHPTS